jgi:hypothetical protein
MRGARGQCVDLVAIALAISRRTGPEIGGTAEVRLEPKPLEVIQNCAFVFRSATPAIVVFQAEQYLALEGAGDARDVDCVGDMT